eukprot:Amastigsp_a845624_47.p3 type:complete len:145 gc:universal Amastigsp_a845624_47:499-933(+)
MLREPHTRSRSREAPVHEACHNSKQQNLAQRLDRKEHLHVRCGRRTGARACEKVDVQQQKRGEFRRCALESVRIERLETDKQKRDHHVTHSERERENKPVCALEPEVHVTQMAPAIENLWSPVSMRGRRPAEQRRRCIRGAHAD